MKNSQQLPQNEETQGKMGRCIWRHDISTTFQVCKDYTAWPPRTLKDILLRVFLHCPKPMYSQKTKIHINGIILYGQYVEKAVKKTSFLDRRGTVKLIFILLETSHVITFISS